MFKLSSCSHLLAWAFGVSVDSGDIRGNKGLERPSLGQGYTVPIIIMIVFLAYGLVMVWIILLMAC